MPENRILDTLIGSIDKDRPRPSLADATAIGRLFGTNVYVADGVPSGGRVDLRAFKEGNDLISLSDLNEEWTYRAYVYGEDGFCTGNMEGTPAQLSHNLPGGGNLTYVVCRIQGSEGGRE